MEQYRLNFENFAAKQDATINTLQTKLNEITKLLNQALQVSQQDK